MYLSIRKDITGQTFGRLTVLSFVEQKGKFTYWKCQCSCGNIKIAEGCTLRSGNCKSCGCLKGAPPKKNLIGQKFGKLTVIQKSISSKKGSLRWDCQCECGRMVMVYSYMLSSGRQTTCKYCDRDTTYNTWDNVRRYRKYNKYDLTGEYGIGWTSNTHKEFWFDLNDYDKIKNYYWHENAYGYIEAYKRPQKSIILLHRLIMGVDDPKLVVDHIYHKLYDNRKSELRITTKHNNQLNHKVASNSKTGVTGVMYYPKTNRYIARIKYNGKNYHLGYYKDFNEAVKIRKKAEQKYFGEYAYVEQ